MSMRSDQCHFYILKWASITCLWGFVNNKGADQPAQSDKRSCYSLFGKYYIISKVATNKILIFQLVSVAEELESRFV